MSKGLASLLAPPAVVLALLLGTIFLALRGCWMLDTLMIWTGDILSNVKF